MTDPPVDQRIIDANCWARRYDRWQTRWASKRRGDLAKWAEGRRDGQLEVAVTLVMLHGQDGGWRRQAPP
jgi:hypothetical protein